MPKLGSVPSAGSFVYNVFILSCCNTSFEVTYIASTWSQGYSVRFSSMFVDKRHWWSKNTGCWRFPIFLKGIIAAKPERMYAECKCFECLVGSTPSRWRIIICLGQECHGCKGGPFFGFKCRFPADLSMLKDCILECCCVCCGKVESVGAGWLGWVKYSSMNTAKARQGGESPCGWFPRTFLRLPTTSFCGSFLCSGESDVCPCLLSGSTIQLLV